MNRETGEISVDPERIRSVAVALGLTLEPAMVTALARFGDLFLRWNSHINLGGAISPRALVDRHFADSFAAARFLVSSESVVDVGSGGGLPAIPLAIVRPGARFSLYEPTAKKVAFLRTALRDGGPGGRVTVNASRLDDSVLLRVGGTFEVATSRATLQPAEWLSLGLKLVQPGGKVLVFGTGARPEGCPLPVDSVSYGENRRLLLYRRDS